MATTGIPPYLEEAFTNEDASCTAAFLVGYKTGKPLKKCGDILGLCSHLGAAVAKAPPRDASHFGSSLKGYVTTFRNRVCAALGFYNHLYGGDLGNPGRAWFKFGAAFVEFSEDITMKIRDVFEDLKGHYKTIDNHEQRSAEYGAQAAIRGKQVDLRNTEVAFGYYFAKTDPLERGKIILRLKPLFGATGENNRTLLLGAFKGDPDNTNKYEVVGHVYNLIYK